MRRVTWCLILAVAMPLSAATIHVDDVTDPLEDGTEAHPYDTIQEGIDAAVDGDTVLVHDSTYRGDGNRDIDFRGKAITVLSENGAENCIVDCEEIGRGFYFHSGEDGNSVLEGFTITNGRAPDGGGIHCNNSSPTIANNTIMSNEADCHGGGIYCEGSSPTIRDNTITGNSAHPWGGGIYCSYSSPTITNNMINLNQRHGIYCSDSSPIVTNSVMSMNQYNGICCHESCPTITSNLITDYGGSGLTASHEGTGGPTVSDNVIIDNGGGGICCRGDNWTIIGNTIKDNSRDGIVCDYLVSSTIADNIITDNSAGIYCTGPSSTEIANNIITSNRSRSRGGIYCRLRPEGTLTVSCNTITANEGPGIHCEGGSATITDNRINGNRGGGIYCEESSPTLISNTIAANERSGVRCYNSSLSITNCIIWGNMNTDEGSQIYLRGTMTISYSALARAQGSIYLHPDNGTLNWGEGNTHDDPLLIRLGHWQTVDDEDVWVEGDLRLLSASPCIDTGDPTIVPEPGDLDVAGRPRLVGHRIDMGAFEYQGRVPAAYYVDDDAPDDPGPRDPSVSDPLEDGTVEHPFDTIQEAIDTTEHGDTVVVLDGTYTGDGNRDIDFRGKAITVRSQNGPENCVIDCQGTREENHQGFYFQNGEQAGSIVDGFTITNGYAMIGGGIRGSSVAGDTWPTILNCIITGNYAWAEGGGIARCHGRIARCTVSRNGARGVGGGLVCCGVRDPWDCEPGGPPEGAEIIDCIITDNCAEEFDGGGIFMGSGTIANCVLAGNACSAGELGGAIYQWSGQITGCTIVGNYSRYAIFCEFPDPISITNSLIRDNFPPDDWQICWASHTPLIVAYCNVSGRWDDDWGPGNIDADPLFADPGSWDDNGTLDPNDDTWIHGDYHLKSQGGRWDPVAEEWVIDDVVSPCMDAGDPASPFELEPFPNGGRINMGAYGNTLQASKSIPNPDVDASGCVNVTDLVLVRTSLGNSGSEIDPPSCDINGDGVVNVTDLVLVRTSLGDGCR